MATPSEAVSRLRSDRYGVNLSYPAGWDWVPGYDGSRLGGREGFLQLDAARSSDGFIDGVAEQAAYHPLLPYGSQPSIQHLVVGGQSARLILPSADQPEEMAGQAQLVVAYPTPLVIAGEAYAFLVVYGDADHILEIAKSLAFADRLSP